MDSFVVMVDAGYLYAEGGKLCLGTANRSQIHLDFAAAVKGLTELGREHSGFRHLRTYWYDAADERAANSGPLRGRIPGGREVEAWTSHRGWPEGRRLPHRQGPHRTVARPSGVGGVCAERG